MKLIIVVLSVVVLLAQQSFSFPSKELKELWDISLDPVGYEVIRSYRQGGLQVQEIYYDSREYKGEPSRIFARVTFVPAVCAVCSTTVARPDPSVVVIPSVVSPTASRRNAVPFSPPGGSS